MQINMKPYELDSFKEKDIYTWDEIVDIIKALEEDNADHIEHIEEQEAELQSLRLMFPNDPHDRYMDEK